MKIAVLFDGAGLARLGLEQAGHDCMGFELDPVRVYLGKRLGSGKVECADATMVDLGGFDAVWASPPCKGRSRANKGELPREESAFTHDWVEWCCSLPHKVKWVENVLSDLKSNTWGKVYNAGQFDPRPQPRQNRTRVIGGSYLHPKPLRPYAKTYDGALPCVTAYEYKYGPNNRGGLRYASRRLGRVMTLDEVAEAQGLDGLPDLWAGCPRIYPDGKWRYELYKAMGEGVPVYMAKAFGAMYK